MAIPSKSELQSLFQGTLAGLAVGDALGATLEFEPPRSPEHYHTEMTGGGWLQLHPGEWTDDTALTLATLESLLERRVFDPDDMARRFADWFASNPPDVGNHTRKVLSRIKKGMNWEEAGRTVQEMDPDNAGNGSLMRAAPLALFFHNTPEHLAALSPVLSRITHAHPDCEGSCVIFNVTIALLINGKEPEEAVREALALCPQPSAALRERVLKALQPVNDTLPTGWVLDTLEVSLWAFLHTSSYEAALLCVVNRGADADTVGAVTGALAGARYGIEAIPERWRAPLDRYEDIVRMADELLALDEEK